MSSASHVVLNAIVPASEQPTFAVVGTLLQFVSTPEQNGANLSVMRGGIRAGPSFHFTATPARKSSTSWKERWTSFRTRGNRQNGRPRPLEMS
jgi:hypothetical protein